MKNADKKLAETVSECHDSQAMQLLKTTGPALFGTQWRASLARQIGVTRETVSRWSNGAAVIPEWAVLFLGELVKRPRPNSFVISRHLETKLLNFRSIVT